MGCLAGLSGGLECIQQTNRQDRLIAGREQDIRQATAARCNELSRGGVMQLKSDIFSPARPPNVAGVLLRSSCEQHSNYVAVLYILALLLRRASEEPLRHASISLTNRVVLCLLEQYRHIVQLLRVFSPSYTLVMFFGHSFVDQSYASHVHGAAMLLFSSAVSRCAWWAFVDFRATNPAMAIKSSLPHMFHQTCNRQSTGRRKRPERECACALLICRNMPARLHAIDNMCLIGMILKTRYSMPKGKPFA